MIALYSFVLALFVATSLVPLLVRFAPRLGLLDMPNERKVHVSPIPRVGGIAIVAGVVTSVLVWVPMRDDIAWFLLATVVLVGFGVWDDRLDIDYRLKFLGQFLASLIMVLGADLVVTRVPFVFDYTLPAVVGIPFTIVAIVGITNAINLADGLDGLAGGMSLLVIAALGFLAYLGGDKVTALLAIAVVGSILGFLRHNTYPAKVFMGDTGSQFLGFCAAVLAIMTTEKANAALSPLIPLVVLALPLWDTVHVMTRRMLRKKSPFSPDRGHFHHKLLDVGLTQYEAVAVIYVINFGLFLAALAIGYTDDVVVLGVFLAFGVAIVGALFLCEVAPSLRIPVEVRVPFVQHAVDYLKEHGLLQKVPFSGIGFGLPLLLIAGAFLPSGVPGDIALLTFCLAAIFLFAVLGGLMPFVLIERLSIYVAGIVVVYLVETTSSDGAISLWVFRALLGIIAILIGVWMRFAGERFFKANTLDLLIIFAVSLVPQIPAVADTGIGVVAIESLVVIYAAEILMIEKQRTWDSLRFGLLGSLAILSIRGVL